MTKVVIIHPSVYSNSINNQLIESFTPDVVPIRYTYEMTKDDILNLINGPVTHLAFLYHYQGNCVVPFFELRKVNNNDSILDSTYTYFNNTIIEIITALGNLYTGNEQFIVDLLCCNLKLAAFENEVKTIEQNLNVDIRYSIDLTGNPTDGGNWVLESDGVNVQTTYFTDDVLAWKGVLAVDITAAIKSGTYSAYISWNPATNTYSIQQSFAWSSLGLSDAPEGSYINALGGETIEGNNYIIDLTGYGNWKGLCNNGNDIAPGFTVQNLGFTGGDILGSNGYFTKSYCVAYTILNCFSTGSIGQFGGGIAGSYSNVNSLTPRVCTISNCFSTGDMNNTWGGGIVGDTFGKGAPDYCIISNCYSTGYISQYSGGIAAYSASFMGLLKVNNCYSTGYIDQNGGGIVGGRSGNSGSLIISNCYSLGYIAVGGGGIAGYFASLIMNNCYSAGNIQNLGYDSAGGLVGRQSTSTLNNCACNGTPFDGPGSSNTITNCSSTLTSIDNSIYGWDSSIWASGGTVGGYRLPVIKSFQNLPWLTDSAHPSYYSAANIRAMYNVYAIYITNTLPNVSQAINTTYTYNITATGFLRQYRWYKNGVVISGQTTASLNFPSLQVSDGGTYYVTVYNMFNSFNSNTSTLEVITVPVITIQPQNTTVPITQTATFQVTATGKYLQYEWRFNGIPISGGPNSSSLTINNCQLSNQGNYSVRIFNAAGSVISNNASLTVTVDPPVITSQPQNTTVQLTQAAIFQVTATGYQLQYEWRLNDVPISGGPNSSSLTINDCQLSNQGNYSVRVFNIVGSVISNNASLTVTIDPPTILLEPQSLKQQVGTLGVLFVLTGQSYNQYQWYKNGVPVINGTQSFIQFNSLSVNDTGSYYVKVYNSAGYIFSNTVIVDVYDTPSVSQPLRDYYQVGKGGEIRMCAGFYGGCFHYQWKKDGVDIPGATGLCYTISNAEYDQAGVYTICATNPLDTVCTSTTVYVNPVPQTCFPFETPPGGLAGGGNLASGLTDMKIGRAQECYVREVLPSARGNNCCLFAGPQISPYVGGTTSAALLQQQMEQQALCNISTNIAVAKLKQYIQPCPVINNNGVDMRFVKYQRRGIPVEPAPPPPGVFIPNNPAIPKATDGYCVQIIGITQSRF